MLHEMGHTTFIDKLGIRLARLGQISLSECTQNALAHAGLHQSTCKCILSRVARLGQIFPPNLATVGSHVWLPDWVGKLEIRLGGKAGNKIGPDFPAQSGNPRHNHNHNKGCQIGRGNLAQSGNPAQNALGTCSGANPRKQTHQPKQT